MAGDGVTRRGWCKGVLTGAARRSLLRCMPGDPSPRRSRPTKTSRCRPERYLWRVRPVRARSRGGRVPDLDAWVTLDAHEATSVGYFDNIVNVTSLDRRVTPYATP